MYSSRFSYTITRAYPYRWITPVIIVGGIVAIVVITFINVATTGYDLVATSTTNPNETVARGNADGKADLLAYFMKSVKPVCAPASIPINSEIYTTNYAIPYTLTSIYRKREDNSKENLGSLVYHNNELQDCDVTQMTIQVLGKYDQSPLLTARSRVGLLLKTYATCAVDIDTSQLQSDVASGPTYIDIIGTYNLLDENVPRFLLQNATTKPSLYWGQSLLSVYYLIVSKAYFDGASSFSWGSDGTYNGLISLTRESKAPQGSAAEVMSDEFFNVQCWTEESYCNGSSIPWLSQGKNVEGHAFDPYANIWRSVDYFGKAMWFTVMTDLGQNQTTVPNMLTNPDLLANLSRNLTNEVAFWNSLDTSDPGDTNRTKGSTMHIDTSLETTPFDPSAVPQPALGAQPNFLSTTYTCQVPRPKSTATRVFAILIADLVLLQTVWKGFKFLLDFFIVGRGDPSLKYCEGCLENHVHRNAAPVVRGLSADASDSSKPYDNWNSANKTTVEVTGYRQVGQADGHIS
ncbi:hypothetical protein F4777DRAFT_577158 [Nemania sp. FL0916]|nr:hypothetical protein F4777DRAFT_577158 [Nemania sp. FL0916]